MPRRKPRTPGRPGLLDDEVERAILNSLKLGAPLNQAAKAAGITERTIRRWRGRGYDALIQQEAGEKVPESEQPYIDLYLKSEKASSQGVVRNLGLIASAATGGAIIEETTRTYRDSETGEVITERTVRRAAPDWRAAAWVTERTGGPEFVRPQQHHITGPDGGPVQIEHTVNLEALASRIHDQLGATVIHGEVVSQSPLEGRMDIETR